MTKTKKTEFTIKRVPIVAVMGHVDHGKTTLLDAIRGTNLQLCEVGGITQNTRAHNVTFKDHNITFIDTPGHEAFSGMRSRGAKVTDIALIVVAADDGIKPQTRESIKFAQEAKVPIIVAANKIDLPNCDIARLKNELSQNNVLVEEYGGDVQFFEVSAKNSLGLDQLLEGILIQAEIMELKKSKNKYGKASAVVLESRLDNKLGAISLVLVKSGEIALGDFVISNQISTVRCLIDDCDCSIKKVIDGYPIWISGLNSVLPTGEILYFSDSEQEAKKIQKSLEIKEQVATGKISVDDVEIDDMNLLAGLIAREQANEEVKKLNVVVRTDSQGTLEVIQDELEKLNTDEVKINILSKGTGQISRSDIITAKNARGIVLGFQVEAPVSLEKIIKEEKVLVRTYKVIYELVEEVSDALDGMLEPQEIEEEVARAQIKKVFELSNKSKVAGCVVKMGNVIKGYSVFVEREGEEIGRGKISVLKRGKNEVKEVQKGSECGIMIEPQVEIQEGDEIVLFKIVKS